MTVVVVLAIAALALVGVAVAATEEEPTGTTAVRITGRAYAFELNGLRDPTHKVRLADGKPTVVNFFASWCGPCKAEAPLLREAAKEYGPDVAFVGVAHLDHRDDALAFVDEYDLSYEIGHDPGGSTAPKYRLRGLPATVFVYADGTVAAVEHGELTPKTLAAQLRSLTLQASRS